VGNKLKTHLHVVRSGETTLDGRGKDACKHSKKYFFYRLVRDYGCPFIKFH